MVSVQQLWKREYSNARYERWPNNVDPVDMAAFRLREKLFHFFGPAFGRAFSAPFDRNIAAAAVPWYLAGGAPAPIAVYEPMGKADLATSYINLITPGTYNAAGNAPSFDTARGWIGGAAWHLLTGLVAASTSWSYLVRYANGPTSGATSPAVLSAYNSNSQCVWLCPKNNAGNRRYGNGGLLDNYAGCSASGVIGAAGNAAYHDGLSTGTIGAGTAPAPQITIGTLNINGTPNTSTSYYWSGDILAVAIWDTSTNHAAWMPAVMAAVALI